MSGTLELKKNYLVKLPSPMEFKMHIASLNGDSSSGYWTPNTFNRYLDLQ